MSELWQALMRRTKTAVAATLFVLLVMLAAAASLSAAAAGISTLSSVRPSANTAVASSPADVKAEPWAESAERAALPPQASGEQSWTASETESSSVDQLNERLAQMQSPVTAAMDSGGVVLGERIHDTFGRILAGLLQTLFVEEPSPSPR